MLQLNSTSATANSLLAFQRSNAGLWRIGDAYNGGNNYFELHNTVLTNNAIEVLAASNEATFLSGKTYSTGNAIGIRVQHNLTIPNGVNVGLAALGGVNSNLNLTLQGSTTVANTGRQGLEGSTSINFTGAGTLTMTQGSTVRAFSALSSVYAFNGSAVGTITHLAGLRICFPDNVGSAVNITNNYALLINNQTTGTGTVNYTNRWGMYQEGASDLNYFAANMLLGSTVNTGEKLQVTGTAKFSSSVTAGGYFYANSNSPNSSGFIPQLGGSGKGWFATAGTTGDLLNEAATGDLIIRTQLGKILLGTYETGAPDAYTAIAIANNRNVGIGTTNPSSLLHIQSSASGGQNLRIQTSISAGRNYIQFANGSGDMGYIGYGGADSKFYISNQLADDMLFVNNGSERMRITSGGNFLIGTTTDIGKKLTLEGSFIQNGNNTNYQANTTTISSGGTATFGRNNTGYGGNLVDNIGGFIIVSINEPNNNINNNSAVYVGTVNKPRGDDATVTQISKTQGGGITAFTVTNSGSDITVTATSSTAATLRITLTFIGGGGMS
jgi:hypothetical protein